MPSINKGFVKIDNTNLQKEEDEISNKNNNVSKNTFKNTEFKIRNISGEIYTTRAKESFFLQDNPDIINLIEPYSHTILNKDQSTIEVSAIQGVYNKNKKTIFYEKDVKIKNKNYLITADTAKHISENNLIIINGNVTMMDLTMELSHLIYCDTIEINTITNDAVAFMISKKKVIAKKYK